MSNRWILLCACLAGGIAALLAGFVPDWDLLNYHLYNPHALLTGRHAIDVAPGQLQTFLNPALHLPFYLLFRFAGTPAMVFAAGALQASQVLLLLLLLRELLGERGLGLKVLLPVAVLGVLGPIFLNQLGGTQGDTLLSLPVLGALLLVVRDYRRSDGRRTFSAGLFAGLLLGLAGALKLTLLLYAPALAAAAFALFPGARRWRVAAGLAVGGLAGMLLAGGPWFWRLCIEYGNPLLPYFNHLFQSPWVAPVSFRDLRFMPQGVSEWLFYPVYWMLDANRVWEYHFRDLRVPLLILACFVLPFVGWRRMRHEMPALGLLWLFGAVSYLLWLAMFSIYRYLSVLELLAPVVLFASALLFLRSRRAFIATFVALLATQAAVHYHRAPDTRAFRMDAATALQRLPADAMVLLDGQQPLGYLALWLDDATPLVQIRGNYTFEALRPHRLREKAWAIAGAHPGPVYLAWPNVDRDAAWMADDLARIGYEPPDPEHCQPVFDHAGLQARLGVTLCRLERAADADQSRGR